MKKSRFTDEKIIGMIKEQESGIATAEVCRKYGISTASFYKFKSKFGGMDVSDARKLKALEDENTKLKKLLAEQMLERDLGRHWSEDNGRAPISRMLPRESGDARCEAESCGPPS